MSDLLGEKIKEARKSKNLTLKQLGDRIGRSHATLSQIERSVHVPEKATLIALAKELDDDFGLAWLKQHASSDDRAPTKREILEETSFTELFSLKFGGETGDVENLRALAKILDEEIAKEEKMLRRPIRKKQ